MMKNQPSTRFLYWLTLSFVLLSLACNTLPQLTAQTPDTVASPVLLDKPISSIEPLLPASANPTGGEVSVAVGDELLLRSHHLSRNELDTLRIWVNDQPLNEFPPELGQLDVISGDQTLPADPIIAPALPTSEITVRLRWIGRLPGTYELTLQATDKAGNTGEPVSQRIVVR